MSERTIIDQFNDGHQEEAIAAAVKDIDAHPHDPQRYTLLATMLINVHAYDQATTLITRALGLFQDNPELRYSWGLLAYVQHDLQDALARLLPLTSADEHLQPTLRGDAAYMVALCYNELGDNTARALAFALTAHDIAPRAHDAAMLAANCLLTMGEFQAASAILQPLLNDNDAGIIFAYGVALTAAGKDGAKFLERAKQLDPAAYKDASGQVQDITGFLKFRNGATGPDQGADDNART